MTISATEREELWELVRAAWGERGADLLMAGLPTPGLESMEQRLTLGIDSLRAETKADMADLRGEFTQLRGEFAELRGEFGELRGEFGELKGELKADFGRLEGEFGQLKGYVGEQLGGIRAEIASQNRIFFLAVVTMIIGIGSLLFTAFQLGGS